MKTLVLSLAIGTLVTLALFGLGYVAAARGLEGLSYALYWQAYVVYLAVPCTDDPQAVFEELCHTVATGKAIFYGGLPLGVMIYSGLAYVVLRVLRPRGPVTAGP